MGLDRLRRAHRPDCCCGCTAPAPATRSICSTRSDTRACRRTPGPSDSRAPSRAPTTSLFQDPASLLNVASFAVAVFAAGSLIARELESGTARLAWTQSVTPARWLAAKLAVPALLITAGTGLLVVLYRMLWSAHSNLLLAGIRPRALYFSIGPATVAAPLLGLALGAFAGLALRRTLPALAVAGLAQYAVNTFRANSWPFQGSYQQPELSVRSRAITSTGAEIPDPGCYDATPAWPGTTSSASPASTSPPPTTGPASSWRPASCWPPPRSWSPSPSPS